MHLARDHEAEASCKANSASKDARVRGQARAPGEHWDARGGSRQWRLREKGLPNKVVGSSRSRHRDRTVCRTTGPRQVKDIMRAEGRRSRGQSPHLIAPPGRVVRPVAPMPTPSPATPAATRRSRWTAGLDSAWRRLDEYLTLAHERPDSPVRAAATINGWIDQMGPCYPFTKQVPVYNKLAALAGKLGV